MKCDAVVFEAKGKVRVRPVSIPSPGPGEILVKVEQSAISNGTEIACLRGIRPDAPFPCVPGYQSIGRIVQVGPKVRNRRIGQRVLMGVSRLGEGINHGCGSAHLAFGVNAASWVIPLPKGMRAASTAFAWVAGCSLQGFTMARLERAEKVLVVGLGLIGQFAVQVARARGARVVAADLIPHRLQVAVRSGAHRSVNPKHESLSDIARQETGHGFDVILDATGRASLIPELIELLQPFGRLVLQGWYHEPIQFDFHRAHHKHLRLYCPCSWQGEKTGLRDVLRLVRQKKLKTAPLITHRVPYQQAPAMYRRILKGDPEVLGVLLDWRDA
jgi:3-hydroxyethyl bacteriochlorophyllide a dehydrogenase